MFEHVKESLHTSVPVELWLIHLVAGKGSHPTKQRQQSISLHKRQPDWADSDLHNSRRVGGGSRLPATWFHADTSKPITKGRNPERHGSQIFTLYCTACYLQLAHKTVSLWARHSVLKSSQIRTNRNTAFSIDHMQQASWIHRRRAAGRHLRRHYTAHLFGSTGTLVVTLRSLANTNFSQLAVKWWLFGGEYCLT